MDSTPPRVTDPAADNIRAIVELERQARRAASFSERLGQRLSDLIGTLTFVWAHLLALAAWMSWNAWAPQPLRFDPYPFGLLTFIVSLEGVLIATFVLIAQNRMSRQSDERDHLTLQVNLLAEQEMTTVLRMLRRVCDRLGIESESGETDRVERLERETDVRELMEKLREELPAVDAVEQVDAEKAASHRRV